MTKPTEQWTATQDRDDRLVAVTGSTPSDRRSLRNLRANIRRAEMSR